MKKLLLALAVLFAASVVTDAQARRGRNGRCYNNDCKVECDPCPAKCEKSCAPVCNSGVSCPDIICKDKVTEGDETVYYVECSRPETIQVPCYKTVTCKTRTVCKATPCSKCYSAEELQEKFGGRIVGEWTGEPGM